MSQMGTDPNLSKGPDLKSLSHQVVEKDEIDIRLISFHLLVTSHVDIAAIFKSKLQNTLNKSTRCASGELLRYSFRTSEVWTQAAYLACTRIK